MWKDLGNSPGKRKAVYELYEKCIPVGEGIGHDLGGLRLGL